MDWIFLALLAPLVYAVNIFLDKYLIESKFPDYRALPIFTAIVALPVFVILCFFGFGSISFIEALLVILSGVFTVWAFSIYLEALIKEETSIIIILTQLMPVFVLAMSYLFLGETITLKQMFGFILLLSSAILASFKKGKKGFRLSTTIFYMLAANILWAIPYILIKYVSTSIAFPSLIAYESFGISLGGLLLLLFIPKIKIAFTTTLYKIKKPVLGLVFLNECLFLGVKTLTYLAVTLGPAALVSVLGSTQIFFGIMLGVVLTLLAPKIFKENFSKQSVLKKGILGLLAFIGVVLVS